MKDKYTLEDGCTTGGLGSTVADYAMAKAYKGSLTKLGVPDTFIEQGTVDELYEIIGLSHKALIKLLQKLDQKN